MAQKKLRQVKVLLLKDNLPDLESALRADDHDQLPTKHALATHVPFEGTIYIRDVSVKTPDWLSFVNEGLAAQQDIKTSTSSAVLLLTSPAGHRFALTFGYGRFLLQPTSYVRDFGVRVALNTVGTDQIRSIDMRRVEGLTLHTRRQASKASGLTTFGVNKRHDLIQSVAGLPEDEALGKRFEGSDAFTLATYVEFDELGIKCDALYTLYTSNAYEGEFGFFDNFRVVREPDKIVELDADLQKALSAADLQKMHLAQPEPESLADVNFYRFSDNGPDHLELDATKMLAERTAAGKAMSADALSNDYVYVSYGHQSGHPLAKWSLYNCIVFETEDAEGNVYMLSSGEWHKASKGFIDEVNAQLATLEQSDIAFPSAHEGEHEGDYNLRAAAELNFGCADKQNIILPSLTAVELADLVSPAGQLVHVKRKTQSATLSHLFNQGLVSAELLLQMKSFRTKAQEVLTELDCGLDDLIQASQHNPSDFEIVYAVVAGPATELPKSLPLFSKITLAETSMLMQNMGYRVSTALIPVLP